MRVGPITVGLLLIGLALPGTQLSAGTSITELNSAQHRAIDAGQKIRPALKLGINPYTVTSRIVPAWQPLANFLEQQLQQPVLLVSAVNTQTFTQRAINGDYFLYLSAPHVAAWLDRQGSANRVRQFFVPIYGQLLVLKQSGYDRLEDLTGKTIATVNPGTFIAELLDYRIAMLGENRPFQATIESRPTHASAFRALLNGSVEAAFIGPIPHPHLHTLRLDSIKIIERSKLTGNAMLMTPASLGVAHAQRMAKLVDKFQAEYPQASALLADFLRGVDGQFKPITDADIGHLMPLVNNWRSGID